MSLPFFTLIIPTYNSEKTLQKALDSILSQSFTDFEVLIVDGLSKDSTAVIIKANESDGRVRSVSEQDNGIYDAMNKGIALSRGSWIYFLGSDDYLYNNQVLLKAYLALKNTFCDLLYGNVIMGKHKKYDGPFTLEKLLHRNISHQAAFYKKTLFEKAGKYNVGYKMHADWDLNIRCFKNNDISTLYSDFTVAEFEIGGTSSGHDVLFLREVLLPENLEMLRNSGNEMPDLIEFDRWWRLIRSAELRVAGPVAELPWFLDDILNFQRKAPSTALKAGPFSKLYMTMCYLKTLVKMPFVAKNNG